MELNTVLISVIIIITIIVILIIIAVYIYKKKPSITNTLLGSDTSMPMDLMTKLGQDMAIVSTGNTMTFIKHNYMLFNDTPGENSLFIVILSRAGQILDYHNFDTICKTEIINIIQYLDKVDKLSIIVIISMGNPFPQITPQLITKLNELGGKTTIFNNNDNYILITSKLGDIYYETLDQNEVYFPFIQITNKSCRWNSGSIKFPSRYLVYTNRYDDNINKCAIESHIKGFSKFGLYGNYCIPMTNKQYNNDYLHMETSNNCLLDSGGTNEISGFEIRKIYNGLHLSESPNTNTAGIQINNKDVLNVGIYAQNMTITSLNIPQDYYIFLLFGDTVQAYYGYVVLTDINYNVNGIIIQKHNINNVIICSKTFCQTYGPGFHIIPPQLFAPVLTVNLNIKANEVYLYDNIYGTDIINHFTRQTDGSNIIVKFPRIIRSIKVI